MIRFSRYFAVFVFLFMTILMSTCHNYNKNKDDSPEQGPAPEAPPPTPEPLNLSVPESSFAASKYCGDIRPELAEEPTPPHFFDKAFLNEKLASETGLTGWIHGAVPSYQQYIFTYRKEDPEDFMAFFKAEQMTLIAKSEELITTLKGLKRHDKVRLRGKIFENGSSIKHILLSGVEIVKKYDGATENSYSFDVSRLKGQTSFPVFGQVHAIVVSEQFGQAVVVERDNFMLPVAILGSQAMEITKSLFKGDIVNISVKMMESSKGPPHFQANTDEPNAFRVIDPMINCHGAKRGVVGHLVKFNKSPAINRDVYAVRIVDANGIARNMTFFPDVESGDPAFTEIFDAISVKAKKAWDDAAEAPGVVRNYNEKKTIQVVAIGKINVVSTEQANAQVYLKSADDVEFRVVP